MEDVYKIYLYLNNELILETDSKEQGGLFKLGEYVNILGIERRVVTQRRSIVHKWYKYYLEWGVSIGKVLWITNFW